MTEDKDMTQEQRAQSTDSTDVTGSADMHETDTADHSQPQADGSKADSQQETAGDASHTADADEQSTAEGGETAKADSNTDAADDSADGSDDNAADSAEGQDKEASSKPDKKDKQIEELNDKYKRLFAEFDNFRKRSEAEKTGMFAEGEKTVLLKVLPLIDNFERALDSIPEEQKGTALAEGIDKTYKAFLTQLTELGVTVIEAKGKSFDANLHNAVMHVEDDSFEDNIVVEEFQKGYMFKDKVLRYSMVKVAN